MLDQVATSSSQSPFHAGELELQALTGKREAMEQFGRQAIRSFMPDQHRSFFAQLPFLVVGAVDDDGWPWAGLLPGRPGFLSTPSETILDIGSIGLPADPAALAIREGAPVGLLGIELHTRRRNRLNGHVLEKHGEGFRVSVDQSFGNCPQYIRNRDVTFIREPNEPPSDRSQRSYFSELDSKAQALIGRADTFYVSSFVEARDNPRVEGVDVSHRGGRPGFVKVDGNVLTIPDFSGNYLFNTLGNFLLNPKAGLVFPDLGTGDVLTLTGTVEVLAEDDPDVVSFEGAQRGWRFTLHHGYWLSDALPFRSNAGEHSPNSLLTDTWQNAEARLTAEKKRSQWRSFRVARMEEESAVIRSFYLEASDGEPLLPFRAGQFLTLRIMRKEDGEALVRTYTVSSAPADPYYRISVKREEQGALSRHLHDVLEVGDLVEVKAPRGQFVMDITEKRPAVLLVGGVGITPAVSMARDAALEGVRSRHVRPLSVFHSSQSTAQRAFAGELKALEKGTQGRIRYYSFVDQVAEGERAGEHFNGQGYITADALRQTLPIDDYDFYLCGPAPFMQSIYDILRSLGVRDARIFAEAFGPSALNRSQEEPDTQKEAAVEAETSVVSFAGSGIEQSWKRGDPTLLELAEANGLTPAFSCRSGSCGSCTTTLRSGAVAYRDRPTALHGDDEVLICCAVPAEGSDRVELEL